MARHRLRRAADIDGLRQVERSRLQQFLSRGVIADTENYAIVHCWILDGSVSTWLHESSQVTEERVELFARFLLSSVEDYRSYTSLISPT